jgi:hypothetical protein
MTDTRTQLLADISAWAASPSAPLVFWLNGLAGTGKSTIARTMCERLDSQGLLAASFFVTRQVSERRAARNIIHTLAYQLARHQRPVADALYKILHDTPDLVVSENLPRLVAELFNKPAEALSPGAGMILVIDALDECTEDAQGRPGGSLVTLLVRCLLQLSGRLKLLITSRAEPTIQRMFEDLSVDALQTVVQLHDLDRAMVRNDIKIYLARSCESIVKTRRELSLEDWPSSADLETLVDLSNGLFVFASTTIRFLDSPKQSPRTRLDFMLARRDGKLVSPFRFLDQLYMQVLKNAVKTEDDDEDMLCDRLRSVVGGVVVVQYPLPVEAYATLLLMDLDEVQLAAESLSAFLLFPKGESVRIFHPSFPDFITSPKRCHDVRFRVSAADHHRQLTYGCLVLLNKHLCYNIANLCDPSIANMDVADLDGKLNAAIRSRLADQMPGNERDSRLDDALPGALRYACRYWTSHLASTMEADATLCSELTTFCDRNLFHWLELLSLIGAVASADQNLRLAVAWCEVCEFPQGYLSPFAHHRLTWHGRLTWTACRRLTFFATLFVPSRPITARSGLMRCTSTTARSRQCRGALSSARCPNSMVRPPFHRCFLCVTPAGDPGQLSWMAMKIRSGLWLSPQMAGALHPVLKMPLYASGTLSRSRRLQYSEGTRGQCVPSPSGEMANVLPRLRRMKRFASGTQTHTPRSPSLFCGLRTCGCCLWPSRLMVPASSRACRTARCESGTLSPTIQNPVSSGVTLTR